MAGSNHLRRIDFCNVGRSGAKRASGKGREKKALEAISARRGEPRDEPARKHHPILRVARGRAPSALRRSTDAPAPPFAPRLPDHQAGAQRKLIPSDHGLL